MLQFVFFKMNALLTHIRKLEMNTKLSPTLEGIILKGCHTTTNTNVIQRDSAQKKIKSTGLWRSSRKGGNPHTNIILGYHSKLTKIPGDCHNNKHTLRKHIVKFSQCIHTFNISLVLFPYHFNNHSTSGEGLTSDVSCYCRHNSPNSDIILSTRNNTLCYYLYLLGLITYWGQAQSTQ